MTLVLRLAEIPSLGAQRQLHCASLHAADGLKTSTMTATLKLKSVPLRLTQKFILETR